MGSVQELETLYTQRPVVFSDWEKPQLQLPAKRNAYIGHGSIFRGRQDTAGPVRYAVEQARRNPSARLTPLVPSKGTRLHSNAPLVPSKNEDSCHILRLVPWTDDRSASVFCIMITHSARKRYALNRTEREHHCASMHGSSRFETNSQLTTGAVM